MTWGPQLWAPSSLPGGGWPGLTLAQTDRRNLSSENRNSELACLFAFEKFQPGSAESWRREGICLAGVGRSHAHEHGETEVESRYLSQVWRLGRMFVTGLLGDTARTTPHWATKSQDRPGGPAESQRQQLPVLGNQGTMSKS